MIMKLKDEILFDKYLSNNTDFYGSGVVRYAVRWAELMEKEMATGAKLQDIADRLSSQADTEGITGFMYGSAVSMLSKCWEHGEELRKWHNGEYAHNGDGVVNPAVIIIGKGEPHGQN